MKKLLLVACTLTLVCIACDKDQECYECRISNNNTEEHCSDIFTQEEITNLEDDCVMRGGTWRMK